VIPLPVQIELENITFIRAGPLKRPHVSEHGQSSRERALWYIEGNMYEGSCIDDVVNRGEIIFGYPRSTMARESPKVMYTLATVPSYRRIRLLGIFDILSRHLGLVLG